MTHIVHPYSFRLGILRNWKSRWFDVKDFKKFLKGDVLAREWLEERTRGMYVDSIEIERSKDVIRIIIKTSRPGLLIGRKGEGIEKIKKETEKFFKKAGISGTYRKIEFVVEEVVKPEMQSAIVAQMMAESLEKRFPFRRVMKQTIEKVMANRGVKGVKVVLSGRLGGAEMSRREWLSQGKMPLQTLRADVDFAKARAHLPYGDIGVKVWIYKEE
ncbi:MAG: 30S ribosomal protein S3 [Candidatus Pacebacteria bacterium]|nr:30S ribosomal protein S3 [Candidatus Paceibacterota bacterium]